MSKNFIISLAVLLCGMGTTVDATISLPYHVNLSLGVGQSSLPVKTLCVEAPRMQPSAGNTQSGKVARTLGEIGKPAVKMGVRHKVGAFVDSMVKRVLGLVSKKSLARMVRLCPVSTVRRIGMALLY